MVFWSGVVGPGTNDVKLSLARSRFVLGARTIALRAHCHATRSKARLVSKSRLVPKHTTLAENGENLISAQPRISTHSQGPKI